MILKDGNGLSENVHTNDINITLAYLHLKLYTYSNIANYINIGNITGI